MDKTKPRFVGESWFKKPIASLATVVTGGTPSTSNSLYWNDGDIPWLQSGCCQNCDVYSASKFITQMGYDNSSAKMMPSDTVMIALTGATAGKVGYLNFEACGNQSITGILPCEQLDQRFLFHYLISQRPKILADCIGGAQPHISQGYVKQFEVPVPKLSVQKEIAGQFEAINRQLFLTKEQTTKFDELVKSRFVEMFGEPGSKYPWQVVEVSSIADVTVGVVVKPAQYYVGEGQGVKTFRSLNIAPMHIKSDSWVYFSDEGNAKNAKSQLKEGDVVIVRSGAPGTACVITSEYEGCNAVDIIIARLDKALVEPVFFAAFMNYPHGQQQIKDGTGGSAQQHFNVGRCKEMVMPLPPLELQQEFAAFVQQVDKLKYGSRSDACPVGVKY